MRRLISSGSPFEATVGYSRAVVQADWCFVAGTTGYDYSTMIMPPGVEAQARNCLATIQNDADRGRVRARRCRPRQLHPITNPADWPLVGPVLGEFFGAIRPAATCIIAGLVSARNEDRDRSHRP